MNDELPRPEDETLVVVHRSLYLTDADVIRLELEDAGIPSWLADVNTVQMDWLLGNAIGNIKVQVASRDAVAARAIVEEFERKRRIAAANHETGDESCLSCGQPLSSSVDICPHCGWSYADANHDIE
ncbi:MAG: hypothetical protein R3C01_07865 [Planctomycetaceae bacterium]